ncbi:MAG: alpha/beta hydrolase [Actinomycetaceae bacterium]|nr:alpha/beta hydrolase [Actinomycetaceae bacterium]
MKIAPKIPTHILRPPGPWEHLDVNANGANFHCVRSGPKNGPTVILLHGFPQFWWAWRNQIPALAQAGYQVIALDLRGFGDSDKQPRGNDPWTMAHDVAGIMTTLGTENATIVGHGLGGQIAWALPHVAPSLVNAIAVIACPHPLAVRSLHSRLLSGAAAQLLFFQLPFFPERGLRTGKLLRHIFSTWTGTNKAALATAEPIYTATFATSFARTAAFYFIRQNRRFPTRLTALFRQKVSVPVLSVQGQKDSVTPAQAYARDAHYADVTQVCIPEVGHFVPEEAPSRLSQVLLDFLESLPSR